MAAAALVPFAPGLSNSHVFHVRDLSFAFWGRYLSLRRSWLAGEWPLWDPYIGGGQASHADGLNQLFLLPSVLVRLLGGEVLGFNLWVSLPFPLAALGAHLLFARRFTAPAAAVGALIFSLCGPVVSTGNFPNLSWSAALLPWVLWATDSAMTAPTGWRRALLVITVAFQALAGEPVTLFATLALAAAYAVVLGGTAEDGALNRACHRGMLFTALAGLGVALAGVQLIPTAHAAVLAERSAAVSPELWSLRPTALLELVWCHLFGNFLQAQRHANVPWVPLIYTGREPLLFSLYVGVHAVALAGFGLAGTAPRRWRLFWVGAALCGMVAAFGAYTPIYPFFRDFVPVVGSLRFPVKYLLVFALALAAGAAAGWDALRAAPANAEERRRARRAQVVSVGFAVAVAAASALAATLCLFAPQAVAPPLGAFAVAMGADSERPAVEFMLRTVPSGAVPVVALSLSSAALLWLATGWRARAVLARVGLLATVAVDLSLRGLAVNPVMDAAYLKQPDWTRHTIADADARVYVGGKQGGTLDAGDKDGSRAFFNPSGLSGFAGHAAVTAQAVFYPSAWRVRELLSYDLPVLWPSRFDTTFERFRRSTRDRRDRFLDRTGARYRILPKGQAGDRIPVMQVPYFLESFLFDFGTAVTPRVAVVESARVMPREADQIEALFQPGWDSQAVALVQSEPEPAGIPAAPVPAFARILADGPNEITIEAGVEEQGGYLVLLDSYSPDWHVTVDGHAADMVQANALFRAVRLVPGRHLVRFRYRPVALIWGAGVSAFALAITLGLAVWPALCRRTRRESQERPRLRVAPEEAIRRGDRAA